MKVRIHVSLKPGVLDPQGRAIHHALEGLGFSGVSDVRAGRLIEQGPTDDVFNRPQHALTRSYLQFG
jgi:phosphoribosylformylglycinamidine synthase